MENTFKNNQEPNSTLSHYEKMSIDIGRDARPVKQLNPPNFPEDLRESKTVGIAFSQSMEYSTFKRLF